MKILTINAGSSSMKFSVMEIPEGKELINGYFQRIGLEGSFYDVKINGEKLHRDEVLTNHLEALECIKKELVELNVVENLDEIDAVGHRLVHGGEKFKNSTLIADEVIEECKKFTKLAPLHNPAMLACIEAAKQAVSSPLLETSIHGATDAIINITNDNWFGYTPGTYQHLDMVRRYAIESGLPIVRANYSGISAFVGADGEIISMLPVGATGTLDGFVWGAHETPYRVIGLNGWMIIILIVSIVGVYGLKSK